MTEPEDETADTDAHCPSGMHKPSGVGVVRDGATGMDVEIVYGCRNCNAWCVHKLPSEHRISDIEFFGMGNDD